MKKSYIILLVVGVYLFFMYDKRLDRNQTMSDWLGDFVSLLKPSTGNSPDLINIAIYAHNRGVI